MLGRGAVQSAAWTLGFRLQVSDFSFWVTLYRFGETFPEIPPILPFSKGGELSGGFAGRSNLLLPFNREAVKKIQSEEEKTSPDIPGPPPI